ncbi:MAG: hypothetical protein HN757_03250 [Calditrichaeota bacterium]|nr:hypothetical protein [Calditrichota bacterium]
MPAPSDVELSVNNLSGQDLACLANVWFRTEYREIVWEAVGFPAGLYLIRLRYERETLTQKGTLINYFESLNHNESRI